MIVLETNVLSALMQDTPDPAVVEWLDNQPTESIWTTSVTVFEIRTGIELLTPSRRRNRLDEIFSQLLDEDLDGRVQSFDLTAAFAAGTIAATQNELGVRWKFVMCRSPASPRRGTQLWLPAILATSPELASNSSTPGSKPFCLKACLQRVVQRHSDRTTRDRPCRA